MFVVDGVCLVMCGKENKSFFLQIRRKKLEKKREKEEKINKNGSRRK